MIAADLARVAIVLGMMLVRTQAMVWLVLSAAVSGDGDGRLFRAGAQLRDPEYHRAKAI